MTLQKTLRGTWESEAMNVFGFDAYGLYTFNKDGSFEFSIRFVNRLTQAAWAALGIEYTGSWGGTSKFNEIFLNIDGISTLPTRLVDKFLKTFKIHISADELFSVIMRVFLDLSETDSDKYVMVRVLSDKKVKLGKMQKDLYRRV